MKTGKVGEYDAVLSAVNHDLLAGYEKINLPEGMTLNKVNELYKGRSKAENILVFKIMLSMVLLLVGGPVLSVVLASIYKTTFSFLTPLIVVVVATILIGGLSRKKGNETKLKFDGYFKLLDDFRKTVGDLGSSNPGPNFVSLAAHILDIEARYDEVRMRTKREIDLIGYYGGVIINLRERLGQMSDAAKKFGLKFDNKKLFAEAEQNLRG